MRRARISIDDPRAVDVRALLERHLEFTDSHSPPEDVHALDVADLLGPAVTFFSCRLDGELLAVGALRQLDDRQAGPVNSSRKRRPPCWSRSPPDAGRGRGRERGLPGQERLRMVTSRARTKNRRWLKEIWS